MNFHNMEMVYDSFKKNGELKEFRSVTVDNFYNGLLSMSDEPFGIMNSLLARNQVLSEWMWYRCGKPYYNVYPAITKHLIRIREDNIPVSYIKLPEEAILFRFSDFDKTFEFEWEGKKRSIRSVLVFDTVRNIENDKKRYLLLWMDYGEMENGYPVYIYRKLSMRPDFNIGQAMRSLENDSESLSVGMQIPQEVTDNVVRCIISCCLISRDMDDGLIEPDVLSKDKFKWDKTKDLKYVEKAVRRGKKGWCVGTNLSEESTPGYRSASPLALYWTGKGRTIPLLRYRKGCWVMRKKIATIPHGYDG